MKKLDEQLYKYLEESLTINHESGSVTKPDYDDVKDVHDTVFNFYNVKKLQHHKDTTIGLYAFDKDIEEIFKDTPKRGNAKSPEELVMTDQINYLKSIIFRIN